jgi:dinuclear metal center YbgI/SA1388 family protein
VAVTRDSIVSYLNEYLSISAVEDYCVNGLQVEGKGEISRVSLGVTISERLIRRSQAFGADMIIVHHGLFWKSDPHPFALRGVQRNRIAALLADDINLVAYHHPLDVHPEIGNGVLLVKRLGLTPVEPMDMLPVTEAHFGYIGELDKPETLDRLRERVDRRLRTTSLVFPFGKRRIRTVAIVSGGGSPFYWKAAERGADAFIVGDVRENHVREVEEVGINLIAAGHYNTEKLGVQAIGRLLRKQFGLACKFIDVPNPV